MRLRSLLTSREDVWYDFWGSVGLVGAAGRSSISGAVPLQGPGYILVKHIIPLIGDF